MPARLVLVLLLALLGLQDDEIVDDFKRYLREFKDPATRAEAVLNLEGVESVRVVDVLLPLFDKGEGEEVLDAVVRVLAGFESRPPVDRMVLALEEEKKSEIRIGVLRALAAGGYGGAAEGLVACLEDKDWRVRRLALVALGSAKETGSAEAILLRCTDEEVAVRCAALEALTAMRVDGVRGAAQVALADASWQVRSSAIAALGEVRHRDSIGPLIAQMEKEEGRLVEDVARALESLTGRAFGARLELWQRFWESYSETYQLPSDEELKVLREKQAERKAEYEGAKGTAYHGIETPSRSILFVIDVSGSMENHVVDKERFAEGDYPSFSRMDIVKTELARTVEGLEDYVDFNILSFASDLDPWKKKLTKAKLLNKKNAATWIGRLEPIGGNSKGDLARAGLVGAANLDGGRTNTFDALMWALGVAGRGTKDSHYEVGVDTIFFLSDGRPTAGKYVDPDDILREVKEANSLRKVVIHTIAIGEFQKTFMKRLAEENGGVFVDLGR